MPNQQERDETLALQITEIRLQLGRVVSHIDSEANNRLSTHSALDKLNECLFGDGDKVGLIGKVNQLLDENKDRKMLQRIILTAVIGVAVTQFWQLFVKHS